MIIGRANEAVRSSRWIKLAARPTCGRFSRMRLYRMTRSAAKSIGQPWSVFSVKNTGYASEIDPTLGRCTRDFRRPRSKLSPISRIASAARGYRVRKQ